MGKSKKEQIEELNEKIEQLETRKTRMENRMKEQERKERTRRLIQVGAIYEKYFEIEGQEQAEKIAIAASKQIKENKKALMNIDVEQSKQQGKTVYKQ